MNKKFSVFAILLLFSLSLGAGTVERDEFIYAATEKSGVARALLLIRAADACPLDSSVPLAMLNKMRFAPKELVQVIRQYNALWAKHPDNQDIVWHGLLMHEKLGSLSRNTLEMLKKSRSNYSEFSGEDISQAIINVRLSLHTLHGDSTAGIKFADAQKIEVHFSQLAAFYHVAAFRALVDGRNGDAEELRKKHLHVVNCAMKTIPEMPKISELTQEMMRLFDRKEIEHATILFHETIKKIGNYPEEKRTALYDNVRAVYCYKTPDFEAAKREAALIKQAAVSKKLLLFNAAVNAHKWDEAKKLLAEIPANENAGCAELLAASMGDVQYIVKMADNPQLGEKDRAIRKFHAASLLKDKKLYFEAKRLLGNYQLSADDLNTIGYIAAELGVDLNEAHSMVLRAVKTTPYSAAYLDSLAYIYYLKRRYADAQKLITKALECVTPDLQVSEILEHAGDIALAQGDFIKAKAMYQRAIDMSGKNVLYDIKKVQNKLDRLK